MYHVAGFTDQAPVEFIFCDYPLLVPSKHVLAAFFDPHSQIYQPYRETGLVKIAQALVHDPDALILRTYVDGALVQTSSTADLVRSAARLLADVTEFMTLIPGDVLALGVARPAPRVRAGQCVDIVADALGTLSNEFVMAAR